MTRNTRFISAGIFLLVAILSSKAGAQLPDNQIIPAKVDAGGDSVEVLIPTVDGTLVWKDVAGSLAESLSLDAPTLERMFPTGSWTCGRHRRFWFCLASTWRLAMRFQSKWRPMTTGNPHCGFVATEKRSGCWHRKPKPMSLLEFKSTTTGKSDQRRNPSWYFFMA